jgi:hypothetical protein
MPRHEYIVHNRRAHQRDDIVAVACLVVKFTDPDRFQQKSPLRADSALSDAT